jgi:hypothetical protein
MYSFFDGKKRQSLGMAYDWLIARATSDRLCVIRLFLRYQHYSLIIEIEMDAQGRKVIVCDNGTGVSRSSFHMNYSLL